MLEVKALRAGYGAVEVLRGVDLDIARGEIVALLGSNGVGKTTFAGVLSGLVPAWSGSVAFNGRNIAGLGAGRIVDLGLIHVPEGRHVFPNLTVRENLELGAYRRAKANRVRNMDHVVDVFPRLKERFGQKAGTLSGGEQQMLAIGRGMMAEPELLILDEPSIGLSPLLVEQNVLQSMEIADRAFVMENGQIRLSGKPSDLMDDPDLQRAYLGLA